MKKQGTSMGLIAKQITVQRDSELEDRSIEMIQSEVQREFSSHELSHRDLWDSITRFDIHVIGVPTREER